MKEVGREERESGRDTIRPSTAQHSGKLTKWRFSDVRLPCCDLTAADASDNYHQRSNGITSTSLQRKQAVRPKWCAGAGTGGPKVGTKA